MVILEFENPGSVTANQTLCLLAGGDGQVKPNDRQSASPSNRTEYSAAPSTVESNGDITRQVKPQDGQHLRATDMTQHSDSSSTVQGM